MIAIACLIIIFWTALISVEGERISERLLVICCDFFAVYFLIFESIAVPHNTMVLFGSYRIVLSSKVFIVQEIVSALIAGIIVLIVDKRKIKKVS